MGRGILHPRSLGTAVRRRIGAAAATATRPVDNPPMTPRRDGFAEWFTDQVIGLRTDDPLAELLAKARGGPGSAPYPLVRFGVMEVEVRVDEPEKPDG